MGKLIHIGGNGYKFLNTSTKAFFPYSQRRTLSGVGFRCSRSRGIKKRKDINGRVLVNEIGVLLTRGWRRLIAEITFATLTVSLLFRSHYIKELSFAGTWKMWRMTTKMRNRRLTAWRHRRTRTSGKSPRVGITRSFYSSRFALMGRFVSYR